MCITFFAVLMCTQDAFSVQPLSVEIQMVNPQIQQGEALKVKVVFRNGSKKPLALNGEIYTWGEAILDFDMSTPSGRKPRKSYSPPRRTVPQKSDFEIIKPGEAIGWEIHVTLWYEIEEAGIYNMTAIYSIAMTVPPLV